MIIGLSGKAHSGKDTVGKFLVYDSCFESIAIAEPMKEFCRAVFEFTENQLHDKEKELPDARYAFPDAWAQASLRMDAFAPKWISRLYPPDTPAVILAGAQHELSKWFGALEGAPLTPRLALQTLGTSWGRSAACSAAPDLWIDCCLRRVKERLAVHRSDGCVVTDVRFKNERDAIWRAGGAVWRIVRPGVMGLVGSAAEHVSETELTDDMPYDRIINNGDRSLEDLRALVKRAIGGQR